MNTSQVPVHFYLKRWFLVTTGSLGGVLLLLAWLSQSAVLRDYISKTVSDKTGREFVITGKFWVRPTWPLHLHMEGVRFANPSWAKEPEMLRADVVDFRLDLISLIKGQLVFEDVSAEKPVIDLETVSEGRANWLLGKKNNENSSAPLVNRLRLDHGLLTFHDPATKTDLQLKMSTEPTTNGGDGVRFTATGNYKGVSSSAHGNGGSLLSIKDPDVTYPIDANFVIGKTRASVKGTITGLARFAAADLQLDLSGASLGDLYSLLSLALPPTPPYKIHGHLVQDGVTWRFHDFKGLVGSSDLAGSVDVTYREKRPNMQGVLTSQLLDLHDLGGFIGTETPSKSEPPPSEAKVSPATTRSRLLPNEPFRLDKLRAMDADIRFSGKAIRHYKMPIENMQTSLRLSDGVMTLNPLNFGVAGGTIASIITMEARNPIKLDADIKFEKLDLSKILSDKNVFKSGTGLIGGRTVIKGRGNSLAELLAHANGTFGVASSGGQVSNLLIDILGLNAFEVIKLLFGGDKEVELRCAVADFALKDGIMNPHAFMIDTTDMTLNIGGSINLRNEQLDLTAQPLPKNFSPLAKIHLPLHVTGTFKDPKFGLAAILAAIIPPTAVVAPLIEMGPGGNSDCASLIQAVQKHAKTQIP